MIKNMKVAGKLSLLAIPAIIILLAQLFFFVSLTNRVNQETKKAYHDEAFISTAAILNADRDLYQALAAEKDLIAGGSKLKSEDKASLIADFNENAQQARDRIALALDNVSGNNELYEQYPHPTAGRTLAQLRQSFENSYNEWLAAYDIESGKGDMEKRQASFEAAREDINLMTELLEDYAEKRSSEIYNSFTSQIAILIGIVLILTAVILLVAIIIINYLRTRIKKLTVINQRIADGEMSIDIDSKLFTRDELGQLYSSTSRILARLKEYISYISEISIVLGQMAEGDLRVSLKHDYIGEFSSLKNALLSISSGLSSTLSTIGRSADHVSMGSEQLASSAQALASGSTEQASSTEELSATIHEVSRQVSDNAANASKAKEYARTAADEVIKGNSQMQEMIAAMKEINQSSEKIRSIIKVIDDIAFQTNILALNAAVEAARAGEEGKGFAVVADEVRNLAAKSAEAANATAALIEASIEKVYEGARLADSTAKSLDEIVESVGKTSDLIMLIDEATTQQAQAIFQISQGINQITTVVQTNSATAEETAATSEELSGQAELLRKEIEKFKLEQVYESV